MYIVLIDLIWAWCHRTPVPSGREIGEKKTENILSIFIFARVFDEIATNKMEVILATDVDKTTTKSFIYIYLASEKPYTWYAIPGM